MFLQVEADKGDYILFMEGPFKSLPHPWNGYLILFYAMAQYFSIFSYTIPFGYRYLIVVKSLKITRLKFYSTYLVTAFLGLTVAAFIRKSCIFPGYDTLVDHVPEFDEDFDWFWRDDDGKPPIYLATHMTNPWIIIAVSYVLSLVNLTYIMAALFCYKTIHHLKDLQARVQQIDEQLQKQITYALIGQAIVPCAIGGLPLMGLLSNWVFQLGIPRIGIISISFVSWTTFLNPAMALWFIKPYRDAVRNFIMKTILRKKVEDAPSNQLALSLA